MDNGIYVWSTLGRLVRKVPLDRLGHFAWRPRPCSLLTDAELKDTRKNMKRYISRFEMQDRSLELEISTVISTPSLPTYLPPLVTLLFRSFCK